MVPESPDLRNVRSDCLEGIYIHHQRYLSQSSHLAPPLPQDSRSCGEDGAKWDDFFLFLVVEECSIRPLAVLFRLAFNRGEDWISEVVLDALRENGRGQVVSSRCDC